MEYIRSGKFLWAILAGISGGLSAMTRYIGVFVIVTIALAIFFFHQGSLRRRLIQTIIPGLVGGLILVGWLFSNQLATGELTNRTFVFHPQNLSYYLFAGKGFSDLLGLRFIKSGISGIPGFLFIISAILVFAAGIYFLVNNRKIVRVSSNSRKFLVVCLFSIITYLFFLLFSVNFFDASTRLTDRILSPLYLILILGLWVLVWPSVQTPWNNKVRILFPLFFLLLIFINLPGFISETTVFRQKGDKFTGKVWSTSTTISWLNQLPDSIIIYSNEAVPIGFLTRHPAATIPEKTNSLTGLPSDTFKDRTAAMKSDLNEGKAVLIIMSTKAYSDIFQPRDILIKDLMICKTMDDGIVYMASNNFQDYCNR
jgi:hypothetical protein